MKVMTRERLEMAGTEQIAAVVSAVRPPAKTKRLNVNLPVSLFDELTEVASESGRTLTEVVRLALGLVAKATEVEKAGYKLGVVDSDGRLIKELVLPK